MHFSSSINAVANIITAEMNLILSLSIVLSHPTHYIFILQIYKTVSFKLKQFYRVKTILRSCNNFNYIKIKNTKTFIKI